jgi:hypothetical protein
VRGAVTTVPGEVEINVCHRPETHRRVRPSLHRRRRSPRDVVCDTRWALLAGTARDVYLGALREKGVEIVEGRFQERAQTCRGCGAGWRHMRRSRLT